MARHSKHAGLLLLLVAACSYETKHSTLADVPHLLVGIDTQQALDGGPVGVTVNLGSQTTCPGHLDASLQVTVNGVAIPVASAGSETVSGPWIQGASVVHDDCQFPSFSLEHAQALDDRAGDPVGTVVLRDGSKTVTVEVPFLLGQRIWLADPVWHRGQDVTLTYSVLGEVTEVDSVRLDHGSDCSDWHDRELAPGDGGFTFDGTALHLHIPEDWPCDSTTVWINSLPGPRATRCEGAEACNLDLRRKVTQVSVQP
jgi:hypothetical protein